MNVRIELLFEGDERELLELRYNDSEIDDMVRACAIVAQQDIRQFFRNKITEVQMLTWLKIEDSRGDIS